MKVTFRAPPVLGPPPPGASLFREATATPGHVLRAFDYAKCIKTTPSVIWGQCAGEAESVETLSSSAGAFFYPVVGDSPWSYYFYDFGTAIEPNISWVGYHTNGLYCRAPDPSACGAWDAPITFVWQGTRPVQANAQGNLVEAYPPSATAEVGLWADYVWEEAQVDRSVDGQGHEHFRARGTNVWHRDRLQDSELRLPPAPASATPRRSSATATTPRP
jgi:hypothetical protein